MTLNTRWWQGARGEWFVAAQVVLFLLLFLGPRNLSICPPWDVRVAEIGLIIGIVLLVVGVVLLLAGGLRHGVHITPLPYPGENAPLITSGPYRLVRHPLYTSGIAAGIGWALCVHGCLTLLYAVVLFVFFDIKSRREERWLMEKYPTYGEYRKRVRRLIPFLY